MYKVFGSLIILAVFIIPATAQQQEMFQESEATTKMMEHYIRVNKAQKEINGWRIQLLTTTDRRQMDRVLYSFKSKYPHEPIAWKHISPYYHVKVGAYLTKLELQGFLVELKKEFPSAIVIRDKIEITDIL